MHLRRAVLLFAIVLLLGAIVASLAPPPERREDRTPAPPPETAAPPSRERPGAENVRFRTTGRPRTADVAAGRHAIVTVVGGEPGQAELAGLGLMRDLTPAAPAVFDLFLDRPGRYDVLFTPIGAVGARRIGILAVEPTP